MARFGLTELQTKKINARQRAQYAMKKGVLVRPDSCSKCEKPGKPEGHHPDYDKALELIWLCRTCHISLHANQGDFVQPREVIERAMAKNSRHREQKRLHAILQAEKDKVA